MGEEEPAAAETASPANQGEEVPLEEVKGTDWYDEDSDDDQILVDGENLLADFQDHFSLHKESCMVRSRKKGNGVRV